MGEIGRTVRDTGWAAIGVAGAFAGIRVMEAFRPEVIADRAGAPEDQAGIAELPRAYFFAAGAIVASPALESARLPRLVAHETYPGHHVECCRAEAGGRAELAVTVLGTPQTVVSEGLAECALDVAVGPGWGRWSADVLASAGASTDGALAERLDPVLARLRRARLDAALLLHRDGRPVDGVERAEAYLRRWLLVDAGRARRLVDGLARPLWRTHVVAVVDGAALVRDRLRTTGREAVAEHVRLLDDPITPSALRGRTSTERVISHDGR